MSPPPNSLLVEYYTLQAAIGSGAKVVRFQDRTVEYQTTDEMIKAANYLYQILASTGQLPGVNRFTRQIRMYTNKGL